LVVAQIIPPIPVFKPRVLVIERDVDLQKRIALSLEGAYTIDLTSSGSLALILMKDYRYACIVASYELPNRHSGEGILRAVRGMPGGRFVPVVATSTADGEEAVHKGFAACLKVPSDIRRLCSVVQGVMEAWD
jgi:CheY-like chemotaxis protein